MSMILNVFISLCGVVYIFSCAEIIGSWILTKKKQDLRWPLNFSIIPILAPVAAYDSIYYADIMYKAKKPSFAKYWQESLYMWLKHGCMSIDEWAKLQERNVKGI
ncbi:hypothetical protein [Prevotella sp. P3-122]|uniref:hypothetical protein n=1 Tax=Prevotella sp. P3-122 TaxID=2024223 RepID=UPI000B971DCA|nr:hypothetical protein [Prevotella sp. P3-122]OYP62356.1 hypothetical protein CIL02_03725 [Prevotella sp. P3-122]